ncbi:hypothetical protein LIA77_02681 [Sarocladium implicatum]|nr:hypothetical protein LIA77_02681 [Sarocladium implicatum]
MQLLNSPARPATRLKGSIKTQAAVTISSATYLRDPGKAGREEAAPQWCSETGTDYPRATGPALSHTQVRLSRHMPVLGGWESWQKGMRQLPLLRWKLAETLVSGFVCPMNFPPRLAEPQCQETRHACRNSSDLKGTANELYRTCVIDRSPVH